MTDIDVYQPAGGIGQYQAGIIMTEETAKALDDQVRACTKAVLRENTDYGIIPGTNGEKTLWRPGAQKLLQWFGLGYTCDRVEIERDDDGRKHGITYKCTVARRLPDGSLDIKATCEGTADYDESKFYQTAEQVKARLREQEHKWAAKDRRAPNADRWNSAREYRADWNALMKRAQKRAIVGAVVDATAAGGIFTDREEDDSPAPPPQDDGPTWYEQALEAALSFTSVDDGRKLYVEAAQAARDGLCTPRQATHIQNRLKQRDRLLKTATPVDVEDLGREEAPAAGDDTRSQPRVEPEGRVQQGTTGESTTRNASPRAAGAAPSRGAQPPPPQDTYASDEGAEEEAPPLPVPATTGQLAMLGQRLRKLGVDDANRLPTLEKLAGRDLDAPAALTHDEAAHIRGLLDRCDGDPGALVELLATGQLPGTEQAGDSDE